MISIASIRSLKRLHGLLDRVLQYLIVAFNFALISNNRAQFSRRFLALSQQEGVLLGDLDLLFDPLDYLLLLRWTVVLRLLLLFGELDLDSVDHFAHLSFD